MEQLNIEGKRSGDGFVAHKATLVNALSRTLADRLMLLDFTIGRKGFLGYVKALGGSNIVKVVPTANGNASEERVTDKRLKVICGANTSYLSDMDWIGEKTPITLAEVRVSPHNSVTPNMGASELADAIAKVLPFTATDDSRPVLQCVNFTAKDGKLTMVSADGFRLAITTLDYDGEGQALISRDDLRGISGALRKAKRVNLSFEGEDVSKGSSLIIDTELIRYKWTSVGGNFPDYEKLIPTEFNTHASFDTIEAIKAISSLKALSDAKSYAVDLAISDGKMAMAITDDKGGSELPADTEGHGKVRVDGSYLASVLKAVGGMVDFSLTNAYSPMLFTQNGYKVVVMPMLTSEANEQARAEREAKAGEAEQPEAEQPEAEAVEPEAEAVSDEPAEAEAEKPKRKRKAKEPVAVA